MKTLRTSLIAAVGSNNAIGIRGTLPWRVREDMLLFRRMTMGKPVIMGRKTYEALKKPFDGRTTIVVTRNRALDREGVETTYGIEDAMRLAEDDAIARGTDEIMVAGGGEIYGETIGRADRLYITHIDVAPDGDAYFPDIDQAVWQEAGREELPQSEGDTARATFVSYVRRPGEGAKD